MLAKPRAPLCSAQAMAAKSLGRGSGVLRELPPRTSSVGPRSRRQRRSQPWIGAPYACGSLIASAADVDRALATRSGACGSGSRESVCTTAEGADQPDSPTEFAHLRAESFENASVML